MSEATSFETFHKIVCSLANRLFPEQTLKTPPTLEPPKHREHGDLSTNVALLLAKRVGQPPRELANQFADELKHELGDFVERIDIAGPGFLNFTLTDKWYRAALTGVLKGGRHYGSDGVQTPEKINIEFVSANPTGPLHVAHGRHAAYGDALARILAFHGHNVTREFYVNDYGSQIARLAESVRARMLGQEPAQDGYQGDYITDFAQLLLHFLQPESKQLTAADRKLEQVIERVHLATRLKNHADNPAGISLDDLACISVEWMRSQIEQTLQELGVHFNVWFSERALHEGNPNAVQRAFGELEKRGFSYRQDGALWLRSTAFGDDKDRVLERSTGDHTYFASDIAYCLDKRDRGFERLVYILGADHHGYLGRMQAAYEAFGGAGDELEIQIMQFVHLVDGGQRASMSKRRGEFVTLEELLSRVGADATRFFLLQRSHETTIEFDLNLAQQQSAENPVYYIQYAHARICSVLRKADQSAVQEAVSQYSQLADREPYAVGERDLITKLLAFPAEVAEAADRRAPHRIAAFALDLAQTFTAFYRDCRVIGAETETLERDRLAICVATRDVLATALDLLGISAPVEM